ncbi:Vacuolar protein sorting-associated protein 53-like protein [Erysiphe neolycopersici]|uniref:Vacuolar protein sorting-associated protein 53-like protein n=1 Tax=Erysiphe neolycopersici TaxID=212602 RepID=A0A420HSZ4_9PEZI|nr:Vacuolar protein sorting-associated protein 53-like protein [Erysiphe neolycopersici]
MSQETMNDEANVSNISFDTVDFDPIEHLNLIFSTPASLSTVKSVHNAIQSHQLDLSRNIDLLSVQQSRNSDASLERLQCTKSELDDLFSKIESVRTRAFETEQTITSMTADIKRLDGTKRNLTLSMTALKQLQMLTTAYEQLRTFAKSRQYKECSGLLQAVLQLMKHFNSYRSIDQIAMLSRNVTDLQRELLEQICEDFEIYFAKDEIAAKKAVLYEACLVMNVLGSAAQARLVTWYVNTQLREYRQVFRGNDEAGSLDNIGRRYSWLKRILSMYEDKHEVIFPKQWRINEVLAKAFCEETRDDFKSILEKSMRRTDGSKVDINLLLSCLQETMDFEQSLEKRFSNDSRISIDTRSSLDERSTNFERSISKAFEPYLSLWVESQDNSLASMIPTYRKQSLLPPDEEFSSQSVITSSIELFHFYKTKLAQCAKLSTGERLLDLSKVLAKYLDEYAQQVLLHFLQKPGGPVLSDAILILNTADYWHVNTQQLEDNLKKRIDAQFLPKVDLSSQVDVFMGVASAVITALVQKAEVACEASWREMRNINWSRMESVGDQSSYVTDFLQNINFQAQEILALIAKPQYARVFCDKLVEHLASVYVTNIVQCRPISEVGAEQMLLDKYVITKSLGNLISYSSHTFSTTAKSSFVKRTQNTFSRIDPILKTLQVRLSPPEGLVQAYLIHIGDSSDTNFRKILELKGVPKSQQLSLVELFGVHREGKLNINLVQMNPILTPLMNSGSSGIGIAAVGQNLTGVNVSSASPGASAGKTFDPTGLGEKLFGSVRDTSEKIGNEETRNPMEGNLMSIGKFFKRDSTSFARFGQNWQSSTDENISK